MENGQAIIAEAWLPSYPSCHLNLSRLGEFYFLNL